MQRTKIEWADYTWNPIKGLCPVGCWYCYAAKMCKRFHREKEPRLDEKEVFEPINSFKSFRKPARIFVCSTFELFHPVADKWRDLIFQTIELDKADIFIILTKMPERIDRPMPDNVWLGITVTGYKDYCRKEYLMKVLAKVRFASYEPALTSLPPEFAFGLDWLIIGRLTGYGKKNDPNPEMIRALISNARDNLRIPVFLKNNLEETWGEPLIQEYPKVSEQAIGTKGKEKP